MTFLPLYVLGFRFDGANSVLLIRKARPKWQAGKINGIGGKIEPGETMLAAMVREFREETGLETAESEWRHVATMRGPHAHDDQPWVVEVLTSTGPISGAIGSSDEPVNSYWIHSLPREAMFNLRWLIPLCLDAEVSGPIDVPYRNATTEGNAL